MSADKYKAQASRLAEHLAITYGWNLTHHKALNAIAAAVGARNWNTLQAAQLDEPPMHIDWGHQAVARWEGPPTTSPLLRQMVDSRRACYLDKAGTSSRIERVNCGRLSGGLLTRDDDDKVALTEIHREEGSSFVVVSLAGAGKSHVMSELVLDTVRRGGMVHSLDAGNSHRKLCAMLQGHQVTLEHSRAMGLNPFQHHAGAQLDDELREQLTEVLFELFATYAPTAAVQRIELCSAEVATAVEHVWREHLQKATLQAVLHCLEKSTQVSLRDAAAAVLAEWPALGPWVDGDSTELRTALNQTFVVIDTDSLLQAPGVYNAVTMLLALHSSRVLRGLDNSRPRLLVIEDAEWHLRHMTRQRFWSQLQRGLDQGQCGLGLTVWTLREQPQSVVAMLVENALTLFVGRLRPEDVSSLMEHEPWNKAHGLIRALRDIYTRSQGYNRPPPFVVLQYKLSPKVVRLELDPYSRLLQSMRPLDMTAKNELLSLPELERARRMLALSQA